MIFKAKIANGPSIHLHVLVKDNCIVKTDLKAASEAAFFCIIDSDVNNEMLKTAIMQWLKDYANKKKPSVSLPLLFDASTAFEKKVYQGLLQINLGQTKSYQDIALTVGYKMAARAVGNACNKNPFPLFIPCHRVIRKNNNIGGFALPIQIKDALLKFES